MTLWSGEAKSLSDRPRVYVYTFNNAPVNLWAFTCGCVGVQAFFCACLCDSWCGCVCCHTRRNAMSTASRNTSRCARRFTHTHIYTSIHRFRYTYTRLHIANYTPTPTKIYIKYFIQTHIHVLAAFSCTRAYEEIKHFRGDTKKTLFHCRDFRFICKFR